MQIFVWCNPDFCVATSSVSSLAHKLAHLTHPNRDGIDIKNNTKARVQSGQLVNGKHIARISERRGFFFPALLVRPAPHPVIPQLTQQLNDPHTSLHSTHQLLHMPISRTRLPNGP